jgi:cytochrome P450 PksS
MLDPAEIDLSDPEFKSNPYPAYRRMREDAPVCRVRFGRWFLAWLVTRYADVLAVLRDERFTKNPHQAKLAGARGNEMRLLQITTPITRNLLSLDPPDHTRLRALVQKAFTAGLVENMRTRMESVAEELLDRAAGQGRMRMDVVRDYALPLPMTIITEMLGVPLADRERFRRWADAIIDVSGVPQALWAAINGLRFLRYNRRLIRSRRKNPANDLLTSLIAAEETGQKLDESELLNMIFILLIAGYETTVNLIGNGTLTLLEHPAEMAKLLSEPSRMPSAVEELLRHESPVELATPRWTLCDVTLAGMTIPKGSLVWAGIASANRDPQQFEHPDALDLSREPNRHLSFGQGIHYCVGSPLARLEAQIAFTTLLGRFPHLRLAEPRKALRWRKSPVLRGLEALPVTFAAPREASAR